MTEKLIRKYYSEWGMGEWKRLIKDPYHRLEFDTTLHFLKKYLPKKGLILDAGGGPASFQFLLSETYKRIVNVDKNKEFLDRMRAIRSRTGMLQNIDFIEGNLTRIPYPDNYFDACCCVSVLEHSDEDMFQIIDELLRVTNGPVLITIDAYFKGEVRDSVTPDVLKKMSERYGFKIPDAPQGAIGNASPDEKHLSLVGCIQLDGSIK